MELPRNRPGEGQGSGPAEGKPQLDQEAALAVLLHEVRRPLNLMRLSIENGLSDPAPEIASLQARLKRILTQVDEVAELLRRAERRGLTSTSMRLFDVPGVVGDAVALLAEKLHGSDVTLRWEPPANASNVSGSPDAIRQIVQNLIENAFNAILDARHRKKTGAGEISIDYLEERDGLQPLAVLTIVDDGIGIDRQIAGHLFEPFVTSRADRGGVGLGLAISRQIALRHGGSISAHNRKGGGAEFTLILPLVT